MALDVDRPFTFTRALAAGITQRQLASTAYTRIVKGVYVRASATVDATVEARAVLLAAGPRAFVSHHQAAALWGGIVPHDPRLHASVPPGVHRTARGDIVVHRSRRAPTTFRGLPVTTAVDTFLDLACCLTLVDLVVLGDSLVRRSRTTPAALVRACDAATGRGSRRAREAARWVRDRVDSPMETRARMLRVLAGLPELETDIRFHDERGNLLRRLDAGDRPTRTATEYDGRSHVERQASWESDIGRREEFEDQEWRIVTLVARDIYVTPDRTVARLARIYRARGMRVGRLRDDYKRHFPGRPGPAVGG